MFHHDPLNSAVLNREVVAAVHIADYFAWKQKKALVMPKLEPAALDVLGTDLAACEDFLM